ncbi:MAG: outer membrane protein OmpA-like peptidoglycan-associated protein [Algoriphagus sp.]
MFQKIVSPCGVFKTVSKSQGFGTTRKPIVQMNTQFKSLIFYFILISLVGTSLQISAQKLIYLEASDKYGGDILEVEWRVESQKTGRSYTIETEDNIQFVEIKKGDEVQVKAILDFYYDESEQLQEAVLNEGEEIKFAMERRPTATLNLIAVALESGRNEPASFEIFFEGNMVGRGNTTKNSLTYSAPLNRAGTYNVQIKSVGFSDLSEQIEVQIGSPTVVTEIEIKLERPAKEVAIKFIDEQTGKPVAVDVAIMETSSGAELLSKNVPNGIVLYTFKNSINYRIEASANGYQFYDKPIEGSQREDLRARMRPLTTMFFNITDKLTSRVIAANINITTPSGLKEILKYEKGRSFIPREIGEYKLEIISEGYLSQTGTFGVSNFFGGPLENSYQLVEENKQFSIDVIDHYSKEKLPKAEFRVFGPGGQKFEGIKKITSGKYEFITDADKKYFIEVNLEGYNPVTKVLSEDNRQFNVELFWAKELTHSYTLLEEQTNRPILNGDLKIQAAEGREVFVYNTKIGGKFLAKLKRGTNINYSVSAEGYKSGFRPNSKSTNTQELYLTPVGNISCELVAYDFLTTETVKANWKYFFDQKEMIINENSETKTLEAIFGAKSQYSIEIQAKNYRTIKASVSARDIINGRLSVAIKRDFYTVKFKIEGLGSPQDFSSIQFRVLSDKGVRVPEIFTSRTKLYEVDLDGEMKYSIEIVKDGYNIFTEIFYVKDLIDSNFIKNVTLIEKPTEKTIEKAIIAAVIEEPVVVEGNPNLSPSKLLTEVEKEAPVIPKAAVAMAEEFEKEDAIGKRYLLDEVYFDKASSSIRDAEVKQLNELAKTITENKKLVIEIVGYTDNVGDSRLNLGLSQFRAKAVANYLFFRGADPDRIKSNGFGQTKAVADNDSEENRSKNRRVEMVLIEN